MKHLSLVTRNENLENLRLFDVYSIFSVSGQFQLILGSFRPWRQNETARSQPKKSASALCPDHLHQTPFQNHVSIFLLENQFNFMIPSHWLRLFKLSVRFVCGKKKNLCWTIIKVCLLEEFLLVFVLKLGALARPSFVNIVQCNHDKKKEHALPSSMSVWKQLNKPTCLEQNFHNHSVFG